jgi:hypothetical protein
MRVKNFSQSATNILSALGLSLPLPWNWAAEQEGLDQSNEQDPLEAAIVETNAILVVLIEGVHGKPRRCDFNRVTDLSHSCSTAEELQGYQGQMPWLVWLLTMTWSISSIECGAIPSSLSPGMSGLDVLSICISST